MSRDDVISREMALNSLIDNTHLDGYDLAEALDAIENKEKLPPVTPQTKCLKAQAKKQAMPMSCDDCCYEPNSPFCEMYRKDICEKKDERQSGKWIDVNERLPEVGISVLVSDADSDIYFTHITRDGVFFDEWGNKIKGIVAWMPLPEPYKAKNEVRNKINRKIVIEMSIIDEEKREERVNFVHFVEGKDICEVAGKVNEFISEQIEPQEIEEQEMSFVKYNSIKIGDTVKTTVNHENFAGYFEKGTLVKVINISERGYDIEDINGNRILEIGWVI